MKQKAINIKNYQLNATHHVIFVKHIIIELIDGKMTRPLTTIVEGAIFHDWSFHIYTCICPFLTKLDYEHDLSPKNQGGHPTFFDF